MSRRAIPLLLLAGCGERLVDFGTCYEPGPPGEVPWSEVVASALAQVGERGRGVVETGRCEHQGTTYRWLRREQATPESGAGFVFHEDRDDGVAVATFHGSDIEAFCDNQAWDLWEGRYLSGCLDTLDTADLPLACRWGLAEICYDENGLYDEDGTCEPWSEDLCVHLGVE